MNGDLLANDRERSRLVRLSKHMRCARPPFSQEFCYNHQISSQLVLSSLRLGKSLPKQLLWMRKRDAKKLWVNITTADSWEHVNKIFHRLNLSEIQTLCIWESHNGNLKRNKTFLFQRILKSIVRLPIRALISFTVHVKCFSFVNHVYRLLRRIKGFKDLSLNYEWGYCFRSQEIGQIAPFSGACKTLHISLPSPGKLENIGHIVNDSRWNPLRGLDLSGNNIGDVGAGVLSGNLTWKMLRSLDLSSNKLGVEGLTALAANTTWDSLIELNLWNNIPGVRGIRALAGNRSWVRLEKLDLTLCLIGVEEIRALVTNVSWKSLRCLGLRLNQIQDNGVKILASNNPWPQLEKLILTKNSVTSIGAQALAANTNWKNLKNLGLNHNQLGDAGAALLATNITWENLGILQLQGNGISEEGLQSLKSNKTWKCTIEIIL